MRVKIIVFDIDGVITDGKKYIDGLGTELKALQLKDLDAIGLLKERGYLLGCISGEDTAFSRKIAEMDKLDFAILGCKKKEKALEKQLKNLGLAYGDVCYIGDGKYDIPVLKKAGLSVCPADAIEEVRQISDIVLKRRGGEGCLAELNTFLSQREKQEDVLYGFKSQADEGLTEEGIAECFLGHKALLDNVMHDKKLLAGIEKAIQMITDTYRQGGSLYLCGNGGSAADAQHLAGELVGRFYLERPALSAEALTTNTSIITAVANDYDYSRIFSRQLEGKAREGDVLIGLTTSGTSANIIAVFRKAKEMGVKTILFTGAIARYAEILEVTDCLIAVPSANTPRIQEMHILIGHMICEFVEKYMTK